MTTLQIAAVLLAVAAVGGVILLALRLRGPNPPIALAFVHGTVAAAGLVTLAVGVLGAGLGGAAMVALVLFGVAAVGGFGLVTIHMRGKPLPVGLILAHGTIAVAGFVSLLVHLFA
jgi:hypothetical protein